MQKLTADPQVVLVLQALGCMILLCVWQGRRVCMAAAATHAGTSCCVRGSLPADRREKLVASGTSCTCHVNCTPGAGSSAAADNPGVMQSTGLSSASALSVSLSQLYRSFTCRRRSSSCVQRKRAEQSWSGMAWHRSASQCPGCSRKIPGAVLHSFAATPSRRTRRVTTPCRHNTPCHVDHARAEAEVLPKTMESMWDPLLLLPLTLMYTGLSP